MCTVKEIREAIWDDFYSQYDMELVDIDRVFQNLPFSQDENLMDRPFLSKPPYGRRKKGKEK